MTTDAITGEAGATDDAAFVEREGAGALVRSPVDVIRLISFATVLAVGLFLGTLADDTMLGFNTDVVGFFDALPHSAERFIVILIQVLVSLVGLAVVIYPLVRKQWRLLGYVFLANLLSSLAASAVTWIVDDSAPPELASSYERDGWLGGTAYPDAAALASLAAVIAVAVPWMSRSFRRAAWGLLVVAAIGRVVSSTSAALDLIAAMAAGGAVGVAVLLVLGAPDRHPSTRQIADALGAAGRRMRALRPASVDARGSTPYFGTLDDGTDVFVKVLGEEERSADILFRSYRLLRFQNVGDERPYSTLRRMVEHEALLALKARDDGIRTPHLEAVVSVGSNDDSMALAYQRIGGSSLDQIEPERLTDDVLDALWEQVAILARRRIAHRDLRLANVFLADDDQPWIIDFGFSELAASDSLLANDVAQLLASSALIVGPTRAAEAAGRHLEADALAASLSRLQPKALAGATQAGLKDRKELVDELRAEVERITGHEAPELEPIERVKAKQLVTWGSLGLAFYFLLPQLADISHLGSELRSFNLAWLIPIAIASTITYVGASVSFAGSIPGQVPPGPNFMSQLAGSFVNRVTPVKVGGMALAIRFAQRIGVDPSVAIAGSGLNALAGVIVHVLLTIGFVLAAGRSDVGFELPSSMTLLAVGAGVLAVLGLVVAVPKGRRFAQEKIVPAAKKAVSGAREVTTSPRKLLELFGGSAIVTLSYLFCIQFCVTAFGGDVSFAAVGFVYLAGSAVGQAAPTPGGIGAVEAALAAGLTAAGMDSAAALSSVIVFRIATFWLPILPGWLATSWLQRHNYV